MSAALIACVAVFAAAALCYCPVPRLPPRLAPRLLGFGLLLVSGLIALRWIEAGRPPFKTLFESLLLLVWCTCALFLLQQGRSRLPLLGAGTAVLAAAVLGYALARQDLEVVRLPPPLQSPWFVPHVVAYFTGYGAMLLAAVAAAIHLAAPGRTVLVHRGGGEHRVGYGEVMHSAVLTGYPLLTAGMILGAIWARQAWGGYWTWDPKESQALLCWLVFTLYFHLRRLPGWRGRRSAILVLGGFALLVFTNLFMHLLPTAEASAHVYQ